jgi:hypothetical protein
LSSLDEARDEPELVNGTDANAVVMHATHHATTVTTLE